MDKIEDFKNVFDLEGKVAIVTGGYGHLGKGICMALLAHGATVIVAGRSVLKFDQVFDGFNKSYLFFEEIDITSSESINNCFSNVHQKFGRIDILVNNAHTARGNSQENMSDKDWNYTMEGVVGSVHKALKAVIPIMKEQRSGKIINITSMYGIVSPDFEALYKGEECEKYTNPPHYGAAKAAMIQLTKYYAVLLGKHNIHVNAISPGPFPNPSVQAQNTYFIERLKKKNPLNKIGEPKDMAGAIILLASKASNFMTGQTLQIDGGWTSW